MSSAEPIKPRSTRERIEEKRKAEPSADPHAHLSFPQRTRGLVDALVFAFVLAVFIRSFVFELFMIPTGSMTPTLIGDNAGEASFFDYDSDGTMDVVYTFPYSGGALDTVQVYLMNPDNTYKDEIFVQGLDVNTLRGLIGNSPRRKDMIVVNKFAYWFKVPNRGDIAVFKVPDRPERGSRFEPEKPVYIKRVMGLPGETITILPANLEQVAIGDKGRYGTAFGGVELHVKPERVLADGKPVGGRFDTLTHFPPPLRGRVPVPSDTPTNEKVPDDAVLMVGDNSASSLDGRYWGGVPQQMLRGRAVLRYWPLKAFRFLK